jgi:hypothetical protein
LYYKECRESRVRKMLYHVNRLVKLQNMKQESEKFSKSVLVSSRLSVSFLVSELSLTISNSSTYKVMVGISSHTIHTIKQPTPKTLLCALTTTNGHSQFEKARVTRPKKLKPRTSWQARVVPSVFSRPRVKHQQAICFKKHIHPSRTSSQNTGHTRIPLGEMLI